MHPQVTFLKAALVTAAVSASQAKGTYLRDKFHRLKARMGTKKAAILVASRFQEKRGQTCRPQHRRCHAIELMAIAPVRATGPPRNRDSARKTQRGLSILSYREAWMAPPCRFLLP